MLKSFIKYAINYLLLSRFPIFTKKLTFSIFENVSRSDITQKGKDSSEAFHTMKEKKYRLSLNTECLGSGEIPTLISQGNEGQRTQEE